MSPQYFTPPSDGYSKIFRLEVRDNLFVRSHQSLFENALLKFIAKVRSTKTNNLGLI